MYDTQAAIGRLEPAVADLKDRVTDLHAKVTVLHVDMTDLKLMMARMEERLSATLPHLATKADLAEKPNKTYMWGIMAALLTAYACGLAALAVLR